MTFLSDGFTYRVLNGQNCEITCFNGTESFVSIPRTINDHTVTRIGTGAFIRNNKLKAIILPDTVKKIDSMAFYECKALEKIKIPDSVTDICYEAFYHCETLSIQIGKSVKNIQSGALCGVRHIDVSTENPHFCAIDGNLYSKDKKTFLQYTAKKDEAVFHVPKNVVSIGIAAFQGCGLSEITLPNGLKSIGWSAFEGCTCLKSIVLPPSTEIIDGGAFTDCIELRKISIGTGLQTIGESAFSGCTALTQLCYNGMMAQWRKVSLNEYWADGAPLLRIETTETPSEREDGSASLFLDYTVNADGKTCTISGIGLCTDKKIVFPTEIDGFAVTNIGKSESQNRGITDNCLEFEGTFEDRGDIESIFIPEGVTTIGDNAFKDCISLKSVWISGTVKTIGASAFKDCTALESVFLAEGVQNIFSHAFFGCTSLKEIHIPDSVDRVFQGAFANGIARITVSHKNPSFVSLDGNLYSKDMKTLLQYASGKRDIAFQCPEDVTFIGAQALQNCTSLTHIVLGKNVEILGSMAFLGCKNLSFIHIPDSVTRIEKEAFSGCERLSRPHFGKGVTEIEAYAFENCLSLRQSPLYEGISAIRWGTFSACASLRKIWVPDTVQTIAERAFEDCTALREISLPAGLTYLDEFAFLHCEALKTIHFRGTSAQWKEFFHAECFGTVRTVVCADGNIDFK